MSQIFYSYILMSNIYLYKNLPQWKKIIQYKNRRQNEEYHVEW